MKKTIVVILFILVIIMPLSVQAITKDDILAYIDTFEICDSESSGLFNKYKLQFSRMLNRKDLNESDLNSISNKLKSSIYILKSYNVCKIDDLKSVPKDTKTKIEDNLYDILNIISKAKKAINNENSNTEASKNDSFVIDANNKTVDLITDGAVVDKIEFSANNFNYVGPNKIVLITTYSFIILFASTLIVILLLHKKNNIFKDFVYALNIFSLVFTITFIVFNDNISSFVSIVSLMKKPDNMNFQEVIVDKNKKIIQYPSYAKDYAKLKIDNLKIEETVFFGDDSDILNRGIGHSTSSYLPSEGGTIIYSAHNSRLSNLKNIKVNNVITISTNYGTFKYKVNKIKIMKENEYDKISINTKKETLVLYTCYPFSSLIYGKDRFVVFADLTSTDWNDQYEENS